MKRIIIFSLWLAIIFFNPLYAQTSVSGDVHGVWDTDGSPYNVSGDISVPAGSTLVIAPGVNISFLGHYKFSIEDGALLKALGTSTDSIIFSAATASGHKGLRFYNASAACSLAFCRITDGRAAAPDTNGGGVYCSNTDITIIYSTITDNFSAGYGGGIYCGHGSNCTIAHNTITENIGGGAGIYCRDSAEVVVEDNDIYANIGAGVRSTDRCILTLMNNNISENDGHGLFSEQTVRATITGNTISSNDASGLAFLDTVTMDSLLIHGNVVSNNAGEGIMSAGRSTISNNTISGNTNRGVNSTEGVCIIKDNIITDNTISGWETNGGGILYTGCPPTMHTGRIDGNWIEGNSARHGGGIACQYSWLPVINNTIINNSADSCGGGIRFFHDDTCWGPSTIKNNIIKSNIAGNAGGAISCYQSSPYIINNAIANNSANTNGGAISLTNSSSPLLTNNSISYNSANSDGGGIYCTHNSNFSLFNCILWANDASDGAEIYIKHTSLKACSGWVAYTNIDQSRCEVTGSGGSKIIWDIMNIDSDPLFADSFLHLSGSSPCIDAGTRFAFVLRDEISIAPAAGLDNINRPWGDDYDLGAYEYIQRPGYSSVNTGWNMIALQKIIAPSTVSAIFPPTTIPIAHNYSPMLAHYSQVDTLQTGEGYWVLCTADTTFQTPGDTFNTYTDTLYPGWNMVGGISFSAPIGCLDTLSTVVTPVYKYNTLNNRYEPAEIILPGRSYWVLSTDTTEFTIAR